MELTKIQENTEITTEKVLCQLKEWKPKEPSLSL